MLDYIDGISFAESEMIKSSFYGISFYFVCKYKCLQWLEKGTIKLIVGQHKERMRCEGGSPIKRGPTLYLTHNWISLHLFHGRQFINTWWTFWNEWMMSKWMKPLKEAATTHSEAVIETMWNLCSYGSICIVRLE